MEAEQHRRARNVPVTADEHALDDVLPLYAVQTGDPRFRRVGRRRAVIVEGSQDFVELRRLRQIVHCPRANRVECRRDAAIAGEHYDARGGVERVQPAQHLETGADARVGSTGDLGRAGSGLTVWL